MDLGYKILDVSHNEIRGCTQIINGKVTAPMTAPMKPIESIPHVMGRSALNEGGRSAGSDDAQGHPGALPCQ